MILHTEFATSDLRKQFCMQIFLLRVRNGNSARRISCCELAMENSARRIAAASWQWEILHAELTAAGLRWKILHAELAAAGCQSPILRAELVIAGMKKPILRTELVLASYNKKICEKEWFSASSRQDDGQGEQQGHEEHVATGEAENLVEGAALMDAEHLLPGADVERGVDEDHGHGGDVGRQAEGIAEGKEQDDEQGDRDADPEIVLAAEALAKADDEGALATDAVLITIAIVVDNEQGVDGDAADEAQEEDAEVEREGLQVVGAAHGDEAEEEEHQQVAPAEVGEAGGVEEGEEDAEQAEGDELKAAIRHLLPGDG